MQERKSSENDLVVVVTGGNGFLGRSIVKDLLEADWPREVRVLDLAAPAPGQESSNESSGQDSHTCSKAEVSYIQGSIGKRADVRRALAGADVVIHTAAILSDGFLPAAAVEAVNVAGTQTLLTVCLELEAETAPRFFVYAGSVTACITGERKFDVDESAPLPSPLDTIGGEYARTKNKAESVVLAHDLKEGSNGRALRTCVLRCLPMYGEGDPYVLTPLINSARSTAGVLPKLSSNVQVTYVGNAAHCFVQTARALSQQPADIGGRSFFVTDNTPVRPLSDLCQPILEGCGYTVRLLPLPGWILLGLALLLQAIVSVVLLVYKLDLSQFHLTPPRIRLSLAAYTFNGTRLQSVLGAGPRYSPEEALSRTTQYYKNKTV